jgi:predicted acetyltransferase
VGRQKNNATTTLAMIETTAATITPVRMISSGTLPPYCLGHTGYAVVPWKQRRGYATRALGLVLSQARQRGLPYVEITTSPANVASQKVIIANGGVLIEEFEKLPSLGGGPERRYRIAL